MRLGAVGPGLAAWMGAALSSLCCLLPLTVIVLGLGSGAFMSVTMRYRWLLIPLGIIGAATGFFLYVRERRRCAALACRMAGSRVTFALLVVASLVVATSIVLDRFPELTSDVLARVMDGDGSHTKHDMGGMR
jgi:mercuric ion transport protein